MAALKSSELKYGVPLKTVIGDMFLTVTQVETPASAELTPATETLELDLTKLGLTSQAPAGLTKLALADGLAPTAGATATTTALPVAAWSTPLKVAKTANEAAALPVAVFLTDVQIVNGKLAVRVYGENKTAKASGNALAEEPANAGKAAVGASVFTVFVIGK